jgi:hypothetical protein
MKHAFALIFVLLVAGGALYLAQHSERYDAVIWLLIAAISHGKSSKLGGILTERVQLAGIITPKRKLWFISCFIITNIIDGESGIELVSVI